MKIKIGDRLSLQSYKHDKNIHRVWQSTVVLYNDDEKIIVANDKTKVVEANGRFWNTREPVVCVFYKKRWYNVIGMLKTDGIYYYCNIASPALIDDEALKYIDYDLDLRVEPSYKYKILDRNEFAKHSAKMEYPDKLVGILESELDFLVNEAKLKKGPFDHKFIEHWYKEYKKIKEK